MRQFEHFPNLVTMFFKRAAEKSSAPFLWHKADGHWQAISWAEAARAAVARAEPIVAGRRCRRISALDTALFRIRYPVERFFKDTVPQPVKDAIRSLLPGSHSAP